MTPKPNHDEQTERVEAFESWWQSTVTDKFIPWTGPEHKGFAAGYQAGKRDGSEERRKAVLLIVEAVKTDHHQRDGRADGYCLDTCDEITAHIAEEKNDG